MMLMRNILLATLSGVSTAQVANAQLFETRSTRFAKVDILDSLNATGSEKQIKLRESVIQERSGSLSLGDTIETYYDGHNLGLVVYRNGKPNELIGFWDPEGNEIDGGQLKNGSGTIRTPFNDDIVVNFESESVVYESGMKNGPVFYYCDCASVLRRGNFVNNQKEGLWKEFTPDGKFVKQKRIKLEVQPKEDILVPDKKDWLVPAHCMMRNPDEKIECPKG